MLFLYDIQSPVNIGLTLRAAEQFQRPVIMFDPRNILGDPEKLLTISDFACGALTRNAPQKVENLTAYKANNRGRIIATSMGPDTIPLPDFKFEDTDTVLLGNEYDGLPKEIIQTADARLYIPLPDAYNPKPQSFSPIDPKREIPVSSDGIPNLNVSTAAAIISYAWRMQKLMKDLEQIEQIQSSSEDIMRFRKSSR